MNGKQLVALVMVALAGPVLATSVVDTGAAYAAKQQKVSEKVGRPLQEAQEAINAKDYNKALAKLAEAKAVPKRTPYENYVISQFETNAYVGLKQYDKAAKAIQSTIDSGIAAPDEVSTLRKNLIQIYYSLKNYNAAVNAAQQYLGQNPGDTDMMVLVAQSQYLMNQCSAAKDTVKKLVNTARSAGRPVKEEWLQIQLSCAHKAQDKDTMRDALEQLVRVAPSNKDYWRDLINTFRDANRSDAINLESFRLMEHIGTLSTSEDYMEMAQVAVLLGVPGDAQAAMKQGYDKKILGTGSDAGRHERLRKTVEDAVKTDKSETAGLVKEAAAATTGAKDIALADSYASYGQYDKAIAAYQSGLKKGGLKNVAAAQLHLGQALLAAGKKAEATAAFKAVKGDAAYEKLATYWQIAS
ncbi:tetratricopeptide repeat protein [Emcibacter sp. SYSU 3D8]|uniref:tetratricopeptide repeat protein n=1 Tax=Emcibacter sp. SYSU 3D8 TaxID=3133969 RepID=UPI0031FE52D8